MREFRPTAPGYFITFEGVEGCGKSTQARLLAEHLRTLQNTVFLSREPGGTALAEAVRTLLLDPQTGGIEPLAELYLILAARAQHVEEALRPALARGEVVVVDRFANATMAYQGGGRGLEWNEVKSLAAPAAGGLTPDLTFLLDLEPTQGFRRLERSGRSPDRLERQELLFHERVRLSYLEISRQEPQRIVVLDGAQPRETLQELIHRETERRLKETLGADR